MEGDVKGLILVVEDEPDVQFYLRTVLEDAGFEVMTADNGKQALDRMKERRPDLISLDLEMPKMRGVKLLEYIKRNPVWEGIPFLIVTSHLYDDIGRSDLEELRAKGISVGRESIVEKPIVPGIYLDRIRSALNIQPRGTETIEGGEDVRERVERLLKGASEEKLNEILRLLEE